MTTESETLFRITFASTPLGMALVDATGYVREANAAFQALLGYTQDDLRTLSLAALTPPDDRQRTWDLFTAVVAGERDWYRTAQHLVRRDGPSRAGTLTVAARRDEAGQLQSLLALVEDTVLEDVTVPAEAADAPGVPPAPVAAAVPATPVVIFVLDGAGVVTLASGQGLAAIGQRPESIVGRAFTDLYGEHTALVEHVRRVLGGAEASGRVQLAGAVLDAWLTPLRDGHGVPVGLLGLATDVSARTRADEQRTRLFTLARELLVIAGFDGHFKQVNLAWERTLGYSTEELLAWPYVDFVHPDDRAATRAEATCLAAGHPSDNFENRYRCRDGSYRWLSWSSTPVVDQRLIYTVAHDVTERKLFEQQLRHQATHDALTGLPNRTLLDETLGHALLARQRPLALLLVDLDRFKEVNDTFGHPLGDRLLHTVAGRLRRVVGSEDMVARLGGDEFAVVLDGAGTARAEAVAQVLLAALAAPFDLEGHRLDIGASVGITLYPDHGADPTTLLRQADVAMYTAKRARSGHAVYVAARDNYPPHRLALMSALREALAAGALLLHYQPVVALATGRMVGVEALLRWPHPERGLVPPDEFIPLAEHAGLIGAVTVWVLEHALGQVAAWAAAGFTTGVAVNLSAQMLHDPEVYDLVVRTLERHQVAPVHLTLEITESALMLDPDRARAVLRRLREVGVRIAIDDFGIGYSSLGYLKDLPADDVKIDKSFVLGMGAGGATGMLKNAALIQSIVVMAHALGLTVVAEGVETEAVQQRLTALRCDMAQGYYLSHPLPSADLARWARTRTTGIDTSPAT